jgi:hypothetical protein
MEHDNDQRYVLLVDNYSMLRISQHEQLEEQEEYQNGPGVERKEKTAYPKPIEGDP